MTELWLKKKLPSSPVSSDNVTQVRLTTERDPSGRAAIHWLVLTPVHEKDCRDCGKIQLGVLPHAGGSIGNDTFSEDVAFQTQSQNREVFSAKNLICHVHTQVVRLPYHFLFEVPRLNSRGHPNNLGILFRELVSDTVQQLWR